MSSHQSTELIPVILYFGLATLLVLVYFMLKLFHQKNSVNIAAPKEVPASNDAEQTASVHQSYFARERWRNYFHTLSKLTRIRKYFPAKAQNASTKRKVFQRFRSKPAEKPTDAPKMNNPASASTATTASVNSDSHLNPPINGSPVSARSFQRETNSNPNSTEGSLTRIVIAQIERHRNEQNQEMKRYQEDQEAKDEESGKQMNESAIRSKLNVSLDFEVDEPIYDVPPSKSLIDLTTRCSDERQLCFNKQQSNNHDTTYFHTSSPELMMNYRAKDRRPPPELNSHSMATKSLAV